MIRGMYAGISGMKSQQTKLDVIGNNLANVGTTGFKSSRVVFKDMLYQNSSNAVGASNNLGGSNAKQVGLGVSIGSIDRIMGQGMMQPTGRALDVAMDGEGFFMVAKGPVAHQDDDIKLSADGTIEDAGGREIFYTRDGSLSLDSEGYLVTSSGERVLGYSMESNGTQGMDADGKINFIDSEDPDLEAAEDLKTLRIPDSVEMDDGSTRKVMSYSIGKDGLITAVVEGGEVAVLGQLATASFKNPEGLEAVGNNMYLNSSNSGAPLVSSGFGADPDQVRTNGEIVQGMLEMSNVDIAEQFTDLIVTSRAFQASSKIISTSDEILQDVVNLKR
ncbi:flagellar hook-basal body complex protein [Candidatus Arthromitus sp. SFB-turkey]|uniref:flagellar hook-basal body complex protein n=1 Tax=Candidatus Arthromitus sp. SFB-turkey TaxID=1840217 RepID=UPI0007F335FF|nr:flagellar hook-basal body complex protein [Candidatus Arthromitus sp. SFB-turkey]OAT89697.1 flagellar biosynthesis protein FlgE [Candidatus Arthromitus sp. SFB-turkey]